MSFMLKLAFALPLTFAAAAGLGGTSTASPVAQDHAAPSRASCSACDDVYNNCIDEGITPAGCQRLTANCYKNCLP